MVKMKLNLLRSFTIILSSSIRQFLLHLCNYCIKCTLYFEHYHYIISFPIASEIEKPKQLVLLFLSGIQIGQMQKFSVAYYKEF